jgi:hypothetical protein
MLDVLFVFVCLFISVFLPLVGEASSGDDDTMDNDNETMDNEVML